MTLVARDAIITAHLEWAHTIARHVASMLPTWFLEDDLIGPAEVELVRLAGKFDASLGFLFQTFARRRIYGACLDSVRRREYIERGHDSIDVDPLFGDYAVCPRPTPEAQAIAAGQLDIWARVQRLPRRHALVVLALYAGGMGSAEVGELIGVTGARVRQIHRAALAMLRGACEDLDVMA